MPLAVRIRAIGAFLFLAPLLAALTPVGFSKDPWVEVRSPHFIVISNAGDKEARKMADQFEQFREVFHKSFPKLRVDLGKPLIIFVVKNEDSLRALIPSYWEGKGLVHPAGIYVPGEERHYVAVRSDVETQNPYQVVYHEYTHAIMNLNFRGLPVWLNEGLAEFYGNSVIHDKDVEIGKIAPYYLQILSQQRLIPIDTLLLADEHSPYYNEANHASMFYAESWAMVHYLMLDPEAREKQLLGTFLSAWDASGNQLDAAQKTLGDLKKFEALMESYAHQQVFYLQRVTTSIHGDPKSYTSRALAPAEIDAERALFYSHTRRPKEAGAAVEEALKADPNLPLAYEAQGFLAYSQQEFARAQTAFTRAIALQTTSYFPYYFAAQAQLRSGMPSEEERTRVVTYLERAIQMNAQFAPAYAALGSVYSFNPETYAKALNAAGKAALLEPGNLFYATNYGSILVNTGKIADAKRLAQRIQEAARTPTDEANAEHLLSMIANRESYESRVAEMKQRASEQSTTVIVNGGQTAEVPASGENNTVPVAAPVNAVAEAHHGEDEWAVEGNVVSAECAGGPGKVAIVSGRTTMKFRFPDFAGLQVVTTAKQDKDMPPACANWKSRRVRIYFYKVKEKEFMGELSTIQFL